MNQQFVPTCPVHGTPMNAGKRPGQFYCPRKIGTGPKDYCTQRWQAPEQQPSPAVPPWTPPAQPPPPAPAHSGGYSVPTTAQSAPAHRDATEPKLRAAIAACSAAAARYAGTAVNRSEVVALAQHFYHSVLAPAIYGSEIPMPQTTAALGPDSGPDDNIPF